MLHQNGIRKCKDEPGRTNRRRARRARNEFVANRKITRISTVRQLSCPKWGNEVFILITWHVDRNIGRNSKDEPGNTNPRSRGDKICCKSQDFSYCNCETRFVFEVESINKSYTHHVYFSSRSSHSYLDPRDNSTV
jgi:hypothetical protein